jgi:hypothetical protein
MSEKTEGVAPVQAPSSDVDGAVAALENAGVLLASGTPDDVRQHITHAIGLLRPSGVLSADDSKGGGVAHVIGRELLRELADALAARCGTNAEEWPLIEQARRLLDGVPEASK